MQNNIFKALDNILSEARRKREAEIMTFNNKVVEANKQLEVLNSEKAEAEKAVNPDKVFELETEIAKTQKALSMYSAEAKKLINRKTKDYVSQAEINEAFKPINEYLYQIRKSYLNEGKQLLKPLQELDENFREEESYIMSRINQLQIMDKIIFTGHSNDDLDYTELHNFMYKMEKIKEIRA